MQDKSIINWELHQKIMDRYDEPITKFEKQEFLKLGLKHRMLDSFPNVLADVGSLVAIAFATVILLP